MKQTPFLALVGGLLVLLFACLAYALWSQSRFESLRHDWLVEKARLEFEIENAENQSLFFGSRLAALEGRGAVGEAPSGPSSGCQIRHEEFDKQIAALGDAIEKGLQAVTASGEQHAADIAAIKEALAKPQEPAAGKQELDALKAAVEKGLADANGALAALKAALDAERTSASEERKRLGEKVEKLEKEVADSRSAAERHSGEVARLRARLEDMLAARSTAVTEGPSAEESAVSLSGNGEAPERSGKPIEVTVEAVSADKGLVVVSGGREAGLREGQILEVLREGRRVAQLRIIRLEKSMAGARIINLQPEGVIREDDIARVIVSAPVDPVPEKLPDTSKIPPPPPPEGDEETGAGEGGENGPPGTSGS